jgi:hypothetical protein
VPIGVSVHNGGDYDWSKFRFNVNVATSIDEESLLLAPRNGELIATDHATSISLGKYCHPTAPNHPAIDRACLIAHNPGQAGSQRALLCAHDNINGALPDAVHALDKAAGVLSAAVGVPVLCMAQVFGNMSDTAAQEGLHHPYVLVRDHEVEAFYTPSFAPAIHFVRARRQRNERVGEQ